MTFTHRAGLTLAATVLGFGLAVAPSAYAADQMTGSMMHKHMKKPKGSMMKGGAMKGDAMKGDASKGDATEKTDAPAQ